MNEIPLSLYIFMCTVAIGLIIFSLVYREDFVRIVTSFIAMILSYVNASVIINNSVVEITSNGTLISITIPALNYFWLLLAVLSALLVFLFVASLINSNLQSELNEKQAEADDY